MSLTGKVVAENTLKGKMNKLEELRGYSAYEVAVLNGYIGTEEEWLASLKGYGSVVNDLTSGGETFALSAEMGKVIGQTLEQVPKYPKLTSEQKTQMRSLMDSYRSNRASFIYEFDPGRNIYKDAGCYNANGRVKTNCALYAQKIWAGVSPNTFIGKESTYDGTLVKAFDWGCEFLFPNRNAAGVTGSNGVLYGFVKPNDDNYEGSYSRNTYYSESSTRDDKQVFKSYCDASDIAQELYIRGYEIPMSELDVGDLVFFKAQDVSDNRKDMFERKAFRHIVHVGVVYNTAYKGQGKLVISHSSDDLGATTPFFNISGTSDDPWDKVYHAYMANNIVMAARHPAAFGVASNLGDKFTII